MNKNFIYDGPYCPCCMSKIKSFEYIHHCLIFINGIPAAGENHLKEISSFEHYAVARYK